jgi:hypothetical protein
VIAAVPYAAACWRGTFLPWLPGNQKNEKQSRLQSRLVPGPISICLEFLDVYASLFK